MLSKIEISTLGGILGAAKLSGLPDNMFLKLTDVVIAAVDMSDATSKKLAKIADDLGLTRESTDQALLKRFENLAQTEQDTEVEFMDIRIFDSHSFSTFCKANSDLLTIKDLAFIRKNMLKDVEI